MKFEKPKSSIERVVGASPELEEKTLRQQAEIFNDQIFESLKDKERVKTPEEVAMISLANEMTNTLRKHFGLNDFDVPAQNIHIIEKDKWIRKEIFDGVYNSQLQGIALKDKQESRMEFLATVTHELLHFKSYNALQLAKSKKSEIMPYRLGLEVFSRDGKERYFTELNEAMTEELTKRIFITAFDDLQKNQLLKEEIAKSKKIMEKYPDVRAKSGRYLFGPDTFYAKSQLPKEVSELLKYFLGKRLPKITVEKFSYPRQRRTLNSIFEKILKKYPDRFANTESVFEFFSKAYVTGNILPIGRLIEDVFGKGSLRKIAELDMRTK